MQEIAINRSKTDLKYEKKPFDQIKNFDDGLKIDKKSV